MGGDVGVRACGFSSRIFVEDLRFHFRFSTWCDILALVLHLVLVFGQGFGSGVIGLGRGLWLRSWYDLAFGLAF